MASSLNVLHVAVIDNWRVYKSPIFETPLAYYLFTNQATGFFVPLQNICS